MLFGNVIVSDFIKVLKTGSKGKIAAFCDNNIIGKEIHADIKVAELEKNLGYRKKLNCGYDVIWDCFFVEEEIVLPTKETTPKEPIKSYLIFDSFSKYKKYLNGDIFENACYFQCDKELHKIPPKTKLPTNLSLINETIDAYNPSDVSVYKNAEQVKKLILSAVSMLNDCEPENYESAIGEIKKKIRKKYYNNSWHITRVILWLFFQDNRGKDKEDAVFSALINHDFEKDFLLLYPAEKVIGYKDLYSGYAKSTIGNKKSKLRKFIRQLESADFFTCAYFDLETNLICEEKMCAVESKYNERGRVCFLHHEEDDISQCPPVYDYRYDASLCRYFTTFEDFLEYRNGDLSFCNLYGLPKIELDLSNCKIDETTILPFENNTVIDTEIYKRWYEEDNRIIFYVHKYWYNENGWCICDVKREFSHFFDFAAYLSYDFRNAELDFEEMCNLRSIVGMKFEDALLPAQFFQKFDIVASKSQTALLDDSFLEKYKDSDELKIPNVILKNENDTENVFLAPSIVKSFELEKIYSFFSQSKQTQLYYISDIHLTHKIVNKKITNLLQAREYIKEIAQSILLEPKEYGTALLINGDITAVPVFFDFFLDSIYKTYKPVIITLGNHELWAFEGKSLEEIVEYYRKKADKYKNVYLLQNSIIYQDENYDWGQISEEELSSITSNELRTKLLNARLILFGGIGFSGCEQIYNAYSGIYRNVLTREQEIEESNRFNCLYEKISESLDGMNVVIMSHMPITHWRGTEQYHPGFVYVSGHTHRNTFYDDSCIRNYSDNQIGYHRDNYPSKCFIMENDIALFKNYKDGVYEISLADYKSFIRAKNISMDFSHDYNRLYMLKKNGFYCFIEEGNGTLSILHGARKSKLKKADILYYYEHMDKVIDKISTPLSQYSKKQAQIADIVKAFGGMGTIHGCIIDIDFYSHIYLNPSDNTITAYWASDMVNKIVYPSIPALLEARCPALYERYMAIGDTNKDMLEVVPFKSRSKKGISYQSTDIYGASFMIKKMQRLNENILTTWIEEYEEDDSIKVLPNNDTAIKTTSDMVMKSIRAELSGNDEDSPQNQVQIVKDKLVKFGFNPEADFPDIECNRGSNRNCDVILKYVENGSKKGYDISIFKGLKARDIAKVYICLENGIASEDAVEYAKEFSRVTDLKTHFEK